MTQYIVTSLLTNLFCARLYPNVHYCCHDSMPKSQKDCKKKKITQVLKEKMNVSAICNYNIHISAFKNLRKSSPLTFIVSASPLLKFSMYCETARVTAEFEPSVYLSTVVIIIWAELSVLEETGDKSESRLAHVKVSLPNACHRL